MFSMKDENIATSCNGLIGLVLVCFVVVVVLSLGLLWDLKSPKVALNRLKLPKVALNRLKSP